MTASTLSLAFVFFIVLSTAIRLWLNVRQVAHVQAHRASVPAEFAASIELAAHQKAADYTVAKSRYGRIDLALGLAWLLLLTFGGGLQLLHEQLARVLDPTSLWHGIALFGALSALGFIWELPGSR